MSVSTSASAFVFTGNGSTSTPYAFTFPALDRAHIYVATTTAAGVVTVLAEGVGYTLTTTLDGEGRIIGGSIVTATAYNSTYKITVFRQTALLQPTELPETGPLPSHAIEIGLDRNTLLLQELHRRLLALEGNSDSGSVVVVPAGSTGTDSLQDVATFDNATVRGNTKPKRIGQLGLQLSDNTLWRATSISTGAWVSVPITGDTGAAGPANSLDIGTVNSGSSASASIAGAPPNQVLSLVLPKGDKGDTGDVGGVGPANSLSIGTVTVGAAAATITGTAPSQVLNLVLQKGDKGDAGNDGSNGGTFADAPADGFTYARKNNAWIRV
jgi:hypothetical protein